MSIHSISSKSNNVVSPTKNISSEKVDKTTVSSENQNDQVDITTVANKITQALETSTSTPAINEERVQAVKDALEKGTYPINAEKIAQKMMQIERESSELNSR